MEDIKNTLGIVQAVLRDAERRSVREEAVMLKDAAYDISDMFDEFEDELTKVNLLACALIEKKAHFYSHIIISC
jgi:hypothetical protein